LSSRTQDGRTEYFPATALVPVPASQSWITRCRRSTEYALMSDPPGSAEGAGRRLHTPHEPEERASRDATGRPVLAGPVEATAVGNVLVQARAAGELGGPADIRRVVRESLPVVRFDPRPDTRWAGRG
jgi:hypothetical protein